MTSTRPRFANTAVSPSRRPKRAEGEEPEAMFEGNLVGATAAIDEARDVVATEERSITAFMAQQKQAMLREPTRPITLRFEESLWQKVEALRGPLSKNDFFKYLVDFYADQQHTFPE